MEHKLEQYNQEIKGSGYELSEDGLTLLEVTEAALDGNGHFTVPGGVTSIGESAFSRCKKLLRTVSIPDSVRLIGDAAFLGCHNLTTVNFPPGVKFIKSYAFFCCLNLKVSRFPKGLKEIGSYAFLGCGELMINEIPSSANIGKDAFCWTPLNSVIEEKGKKAKNQLPDDLKNEDRSASLPLCAGEKEEPIAGESKGDDSLPSSEPGNQGDNEISSSLFLFTPTGNNQTTAAGAEGKREIGAFDIDEGGEQKTGDNGSTSSQCSISWTPLNSVIEEKGKKAKNQLPDDLKNEDRSASLPLCAGEKEEPIAGESKGDDSLPSSEPGNQGDNEISSSLFLFTPTGNNQPTAAGAEGKREIGTFDIDEGGEQKTGDNGSTSSQCSIS